MISSAPSFLDSFSSLVIRLLQLILPFTLPSAHVKALCNPYSLARVGDASLSYLPLQMLKVRLLGNLEFNERTCAYLINIFELLCTCPPPVSTFLKSQVRLYTCWACAGKRWNGESDKKYQFQTETSLSTSFYPWKQSKTIFISLLIHSGSCHWVPFGCKALCRVIWKVSVLGMIQTLGPRSKGIKCCRPSVLQIFRGVQLVGESRNLQQGGYNLSWTSKNEWESDDICSSPMSCSILDPCRWQPRICHRWWTREQSTPSAWTVIFSPCATWQIPPHLSPSSCLPPSAPQAAIVHVNCC